MKKSSWTAGSASPRQIRWKMTEFRKAGATRRPSHPACPRQQSAKPSHKRTAKQRSFSFVDGLVFPLGYHVAPLEAAQLWFYIYSGDTAGGKRPTVTWGWPLARPSTRRRPFTASVSTSTKRLYRPRHHGSCYYVQLSQRCWATPELVIIDGLQPDRAEVRPAA